MNELAFALEKTKKFNELVLNDEYLAKILVFGEYNFLQLYNPLIFLDFRNYYKKNNSEVVQKDNFGQSTLSIIFFGSTSIILSFLALIWFKLSKKQIIVFSNDVCNSKFQGDFRLTKIYQYLISKKIKFAEMFFSINDKRLIKNLIERQRFAIYSQTLDIFYKIFGKNKVVVQKSFASDLEGDGKIMNQILDTYLTKINLTKFKIRFFEKILRFLKIKTILTIDSVRRYGELVAAAKNLKIPVLAFQHGQFTKYQTGWLDMTGHRENIIHPDKLLVWADYWKNELLRLGTYYDNQEIDFCENTKSDFLFSQVNIEKPTQKNVLMVFETDAPKDLAQRYIQKIIDCPETKLFFKPRPDRDLNEQLKIYGLDKVRSDLEIITDLAKELDKINIVFGFQSTMLYEMIVEKKAVGVLDSDLDYTEGLILAGFAEKIGLDNICPALHTLGGKGEDELKKLSDKFVGENIKTISNILHSYV